MNYSFEQKQSDEWLWYFVNDYDDYLNDYESMIFSYLINLGINLGPGNLESV